MNVNIGTRRLQAVKDAYTLNIPIVAVRSLGLKTFDKLDITIMEDGSLKIEKDKDELYE